ncbi:MAG: PQQ-dependent sugar dehydrogenase, partial [Gemmatimonadetes bacterium]|nr:PQQ-dependent sugar dehydrogenase [Gemmatimonadota bacterium]
SGLLLLIGFVGVACGESDAPTEPDAPSSIGLAMVAEGLTAPVALVKPPGGAGRRMIVDQTGVIRILAADANLLAEPFLDVRGKLVPLRPGYDERGLLGLAFHPGHATNGRFFVYYSTPRRSDTPAGFDHVNRLSEFRLSADRNRADAASERILLEMPHPQSNHNGGTIAFGPDGNLYLSLSLHQGRRRKVNHWSLSRLASVLVVASAACSDGGDSASDAGPAGPATPAASAPLEIRLTRDLKFNPSVMSVAPGTRVRWTNDGNVTHTITPENAVQKGVWVGTTSRSPGNALEHTFTETDQTYHYRCDLHPGMTGSIQVSAAPTRDGY